MYVNTDNVMLLQCLEYEISFFFFLFLSFSVSVQEPTPLQSIAGAAITPKKLEKIKISPRFSCDLNLVPRFLISTIRFLNFIYVSN